MSEPLIENRAIFSGGETREVRADPAPLTLHLPSGAAKGNVVIVPGWSGPRSGPADLLVYLADELCRAGWAVARLDLPGRGDAPGKFNAVDLDGMIAAAGKAFDTRAAGHTYFLGLCSGANVALGVAAQSAGEVGVIALSTLPFQPARGAAYERRRRWRNLKQYLAKAFALESWRRLITGQINLSRVKKNLTASERPAEGARNLKDSVRDIEAELTRWQGPALFIWGGGDEETPLARAHFEALHARGLGRPGLTFFETVAGANHNFYNRAWREQLAASILKFIE